MVRESEGENLPEQRGQPAPISDEGLVQAARFEFLRGPLPPPDILAGYENVVTGAGERILQMAEQEASHRQGLEKKVTERDATRSLLGVVGAVVIALAAFALAGYAFYLDQPWAGGVLGGIPVAIMVTTFIRETRR